MGPARHGQGQHSARAGEAKGPEAVARRPRRRSGLREPRPSLSRREPDVQGRPDPSRRFRGVVLRFVRRGAGDAGAPDPDRRGARARRPAGNTSAGVRGRRRLRVARRRARAHRRREGQPGRDGAPARHRPGARPPVREHRALRARAAGEQRALVGRPRHGQVVARQGRARGDQQGAGSAPETRTLPSSSSRSTARTSRPCRS